MVCKACDNEYCDQHCAGRTVGPLEEIPDCNHHLCDCDLFHNCDSRWDIWRQHLVLSPRTQRPALDRIDIAVMHLKNPDHLFLRDESHIHIRAIELALVSLNRDLAQLGEQLQERRPAVGDWGERNTPTVEWILQQFRWVLSRPWATGSNESRPRAVRRS
tara:strand:+ start:364 stop:843 length:480 start_codon:yes stop_codon:yes gene_type:complete